MYQGKFMELKIVGKNIPRHDAFEKASGTTCYAADFFLEGMLYGKVLRSPHASARILSIDTTAAENFGGVKAVLTAKDIFRNEFVTRFGQTDTLEGGYEAVYRVLADKKVHFIGEPVALVAAETEEIAEKALEMIKVEYQPLPGVFDPLDAMKPEAPQVEEGRSNIITHCEVRKGNVEEGFSQADIIVENTYRVPFVDHAYLEPECGVSWIDENGIFNIRVATQIVDHYMEVADVLGIPHDRVRVFSPYVGGGFGGKLDITVENFLALLTDRTKRPVKLTYTREESILCHSKRHPYTMIYKMGVKKDGRLTALEAELISDAGAYVYLSPWVLLLSTVMATGPYRIPHVKIDGFTVLTNNIFTSANRGFGAPQVCFACESQMDELAKRVGINPLELRSLNYLSKGETLGTGEVIENYVAIKETAEKVFQALGEKSEEKPNLRIGQGIASGMTCYGRPVFRSDTSKSYVSIELDGSVTIRTGIQDLGGGQASSLCQLAAEMLGVPLENIKIYIADSALTPRAGWATATRQLYMAGNATLMAAQEVRTTLLKKAGEIMGTDPKKLILADMEAIDGESGRSLPLSQVVKACASSGLPLYHTALFEAPARNLTQFGHVEGKIYPDYTFGSHAAEVSVDLETGEVQVLKLISCLDVGKAINPQSVEGQLEGGAIYGLGYALTEEIILENGVTMTPSFSEYLIPTSMDVPDIETILIESGEGLGPFGAKGVGEPALISVAPAICNAVCDAIGTRIFDLPLTPEKIVKAFKEKCKAT
jgi:CO/xanthine dehydrogenase Mo-binding subunit